MKSTRMGIYLASCPVISWRLIERITELLYQEKGQISDNDTLLTGKNDKVVIPIFEYDKELI